MHQINHLPPGRMTPEQRRHEIASLLANGLARLRISGAEQSTTRAEARGAGLSFWLLWQPARSYRPVNKTITESK